MKASYVAYYLTTQEVIWLMSFLWDLNLNPRVYDPIDTICNSTIAIQFIKDMKLHRKTKHIKTCYLYATS